MVVCMITPRQIRAARALLGWSQQQLADKAIVIGQRSCPAGTWRGWSADEHTYGRAQGAQRCGDRVLTGRREGRGGEAEQPEGV